MWLAARTMADVATPVRLIKYPTRYRLPPSRSVSVAQASVETMPTAGTPVGYVLSWVMVYEVVGALFMYSASSELELKDSVSPATTQSPTKPHQYHDVSTRRANPRVRGLRRASGAACSGTRATASRFSSADR